MYSVPFWNVKLQRSGFAIRAEQRLFGGGMVQAAVAPIAMCSPVTDEWQMPGRAKTWFGTLCSEGLSLEPVRSHAKYKRMLQHGFNKGVQEFNLGVVYKLQFTPPCA